MNLHALQSQPVYSQPTRREWVWVPFGQRTRIPLPVQKSSPDTFTRQARPAPAATSTEAPQPFGLLDNYLDWLQDFEL